MPPTAPPPRPVRPLLRMDIATLKPLPTGPSTFSGGTRTPEKATVVVDDAAQGVTDVVRGADLLDSTARQIYLQRLLGLPAPRYMHVPVAVNAAGEKLSKQTLATPVDISQPLAALCAALRFLGHAPPAEVCRDSVVALWEWAFANWDPARIAPVRYLPAPRKLA